VQEVFQLIRDMLAIAPLFPLLCSILAAFLLRDNLRSFARFSCDPYKIVGMRLSIAVNVQLGHRKI
jgi:hypothetical protein